MRRSQPRVRRLQRPEEKLSELPGKFPTNPTSKNAVTRARDSFGNIDILVNSAGMTIRGPGTEFPLETWNEIIATNLTGTFLFCREVSRSMIEAGGAARS